MARKTVARSLPSLQSLHPHFRKLDPHQNFSVGIADLLRKTIEQVRGPDPKPFYSVREAATFFGVSFRTIANTYERLEAEGLLTRIRGSQTLMPGRKLQPRHPVRGVVGIAIALPSFVYGTILRSLYVRFEEELRAHRYVADFIFYREDEERDRPNQLAERLLAHQLDVVVWMAPAQAAVPVMLLLQDGGLPLVVVGDGKARYPREQYYVDLGAGIAEGLHAWQKEGIRSVAMFIPETGANPYDLETARRQAERAGVELEAFQVSDSETAERLDRLARSAGRGVILVPYHWYDLLCDQFPSVMERLFRSCRVMLLQGAISHGYFRNKPVQADSVTWPGEDMARRIVRDISAQNISTGRRLATFPTRWQPRVDLGKVSPDLWTDAQAGT